MKLERFGGGMNMEGNDLYSRVSREAIAILQSKDPKLNMTIMEMILNDPGFKKEVKTGWDRTTLSQVNKDVDPEKQEKLWAQDLAIRLEEELKKQEDEERAA